MRIIHVEDYFDPTAGYQINELLIASMDFNDDIFIITSKDMTPFHKQFDKKVDKEFEQKTGIKIIRLETRIKLSTRLILKGLKKRIEEINPDVVYMHGIGDFKDFQLWLPKSSYKIVRDCHMSWVASKNKFRKFFYYVYKMFFASIINKTNKYDVIYALGDEEYEYLKGIGICDEKIEFLRHGYNDSIMFYNENERKQIRDQYEFKNNDIVISYIGKFNKSKRPDLIMDIINIIGTEFITKNNIKLLFIGSKDEVYMKEFDKKISKGKKKIEVVIDEAKTFKELRKYYSASDICIFPKETSLSSIHAQVCGCPVVMENHQSNIERVVNDKNLYKIDDLNQAAIILKRIINNREYLKIYKETENLKNREYKNQVKEFKSRVNK